MTWFCELQKASGITPWKNATATALALLITGCAHRRLLFKNKTGSSSTKGNHHLSLRFQIWQEETVDGAKIAGAENVVKMKLSKHSWRLLGFITLGIYTPLEARVYCSQYCMSCPPIRATLSALPAGHTSGSSSCFCIVISPLRVNNPVQRCLPVGGGCIIHAGGGGGFTHWLTDCFDVQPTTTSGNIITQSIIFSFSIS